MRGLLSFLAFGLLAAAQDDESLSIFQKLRARRALRARQLEERRAETDVVHLEKRAPQFLSSSTQKFAVDGSKLPQVNFDVGESYAGLLPISNSSDETRELFFWFFPSTIPGGSKDITIWIQGGPGCASTGGLLLENGPLLFQPGTVRPMKNNFSWTNLTNMVWVDQPVGTGFSVGKPNITNEYELAQQFMGFWKNFIQTFSMQGYKVYIAGESYGGYYVPYISNGFVQANDTQYYNFKGAAINDPIIGNQIYQFEAVAGQFMNTWSNVFDLDPSTMATINKQNENCGYPAYLDKYFTFPPPKGPFPGIFGSKNYDQEFKNGCNVQGAIIEAVLAKNPCFNEDHILDTCPIPWSPLGPDLYALQPAGPAAYYNLPAVRKAIHAPAGVKWSFCANEDVFVGKNVPWSPGGTDDSLPPAATDILPNIIEHTNNIIVGVGGLDFQLPANGTLLCFQNMTWNNGQGFSNYPNQPINVPKFTVPSGSNSQSGYGQMGTWVSERGFTFYVDTLAGHEQPWYQPGVMYRVIQTMLGQIPNLSSTSNF